MRTGASQTLQEMLGTWVEPRRRSAQMRRAFVAKSRAVPTARMLFGIPFDLLVAGNGHGFCCFNTYWAFPPRMTVGSAIIASNIEECS